MSERTPDDDLLALYRRAARETPSAAIDARILRIAAHAGRRRKAWTALALTACLLLALGGLERPWRTPSAPAAPRLGIVAIPPEALGNSPQAELMRMDVLPPRPPLDEALLRLQPDR